MSFWAFVHGFLGSVLIAGLAVAIWQSLSPPTRSLAPLRVNAVALVVVAALVDLLGDIAYVTYRIDTKASPRSLILAGNKPWVHEILMEFKEHVAHFVPPILLVAVALVFVYDIRHKQDRTAGKVAAVVFALALLVTLTVLFMGAYINSVAPIR